MKYTENAQVLQVGDGFWKTAGGIGNYKHVFTDPEFGQVAMMGTMREANTTILMSLRLRIELGRITETATPYLSALYACASLLAKGLREQKARLRLEALA